MASSSLSQPTAPPSSPSKRQKLSLQEEADGVDRISDLPDCLLCHILSFLPTKESVATSILSSRWKTLWTFVPCLYLHLFYLRSSLSVPHIMSRVFAQHKALCLRKFVLNADWDCDPFHVDTWVCASISPNLEKLVLRYSDDDEQMFELPRSIFSCKNLVVLKLSGQIFLSLPSSFKLPSLKILHLFLTRFSSNFNDDPDWMLLSGCPVLEDLVLEREGEDYIDKDFVKLEICVPTLKRLEFYFSIDAPDHPNYELEINAPALEFFNFRGDLREVVFLENLPNLVEANVDIDVFDYFGESDDEDEDDYVNMLYHADKVVGLLRELYNVKFLSLSQGATDTESLSFACYHYDVPMFHNLVRLNYEFNCCNWHLLRDLLEKAPNLEVLVVHKVYCRSYEHPPDCVKQPLNIRRVLSPHLTTFHFGGVKGLKGELKFVRCILKKSSVLKKMTLGYRDNLQNVEEEKSRFLKKVSNFPRSSMSCQIAFE